MTHIAIAEKLNGSPVDWMEKVRDDQYRRRAGALAERPKEEDQCKSANSAKADWKSRPSASAAWA